MTDLPTDRADQRTGNGETAGTGPMDAGRRKLIKVGAIAAPAVITLSATSAQAATSLLLCEIPIPSLVTGEGVPFDPGSAKLKMLEPGVYKVDSGDQKGLIVFAAPETGFYTGEEVRTRIGNGEDVMGGPFQAHVNYIKSLQRDGTGNGYSCFASIRAAML